MNSIKCFVNWISLNMPYLFLNGPASVCPGQWIFGQIQPKQTRSKGEPKVNNEGQRRKSRHNGFFSTRFFVKITFGLSRLKGSTWSGSSSVRHAICLFLCAPCVFHLLVACSLLVYSVIGTWSHLQDAASPTNTQEIAVYREMAGNDCNAGLSKNMLDGCRICRD